MQQLEYCVSITDVHSLIECWFCIRIFPKTYKNLKMPVLERLLPVLLLKLKKDPNFQAAQVSLAHKHLSFFPPKAENEKRSFIHKSAMFHLLMQLHCPISGKIKKEQLQGYT